MKPFEHGGRVYDADGRQKNWLDFSANINPLGMPSTVRTALTRSLDAKLLSEE